MSIKASVVRSQPITECVFKTSRSRIVLMMDFGTDNCSDFLAKVVCKKWENTCRLWIYSRYAIFRD